MNKKLLFAAMSLAALTACTDNDFESKNVANVAGETSPVQFEVINVNDAEGTRASMDGNKVVWSATDGDLFTLYHGATLGNTNGHENATYTASLGDDGTAVLTTPSMIKDGGAVMVWPVDTTFYYDIAGALTIKIPDVQGGIVDGKETIQNQIPYVSDEIDIDVYSKFDNDPTSAGYNEYNSAGKDRKYKVFMRPMASQLNLIADYAGTDATLATLYAGDDPIDPIKLTSVDLLTTTGGGTTDFTQEIGVKFTAPTPAITTQWAGVANSAWNNVTDFDLTNIVADVDQLTTKSLNGNESCKFLILPQNTIPAAGVDDGGVVVNTIYGKVVIANVADADNHGTMYNTAGATGEIEDAWYRFVTDPTAIVAGETAAAAPEASGEHAGKYKVTSEPKIGMEQTINAFSANKAASGVVKGEPQGAAAIRYVKVLLTHLDMSDLHITSDKQLYDAVRVWEKMGLPSVNVYLDGEGTNNGFLISQKTIKKINEINAAATGRFFGVKPCSTHTCDEIVVTGGDKIEDMTFIFLDGTHDADVVLQTGYTWKWDGTVKVAPVGTGVTNTGINEIINRGTLENAGGKVLNIMNPLGTVVEDITFVNDTPGKWNITAGRIRVQNSLRNNGTINISIGAQLVEDGVGLGAGNAVFTNNALGLPTRFGGDNRMGKINNDGVLATISGGVINNYGLIEHGPTPGNLDAKTYITSNQTAAASFGTAFTAGLTGNMMGRINLPYTNKDEDNISIGATDTPPFEGFISVTVNGDAPTATLNTAAVGKFVNYIIVKSGIDEISFLPAQVEYLEVATNKEVYWSVPTTTPLKGLIVLSDVNIKLGTQLKSTVTYLGAEMYVGGEFNWNSAILTPNTNWDGYYGVTSTRVAEHYLTY